MLKEQREIKFVSVKRLQTADCIQGIKTQFLSIMLIFISNYSS